MSHPEPNSRARDKQNQLNSIIKGYPLTSTPVVPNILKHQVDFQHIKMSDGTKRVGITFAHAGSTLVNLESIEVMRKKLLQRFPAVNGLTEHVQNRFPKNVIAVSSSQFNFEVGGSCHEFRLCNGYKEAVGSGYTYRKMSECLQFCYYNENGVEFLAGMIFYPAPNGSPMLLKSNDALIYIGIGSAIGYPLRDRNKCHIMEKYRKYGRYCAASGRVVMVKVCKEDGVPRHINFDHVNRKWKRESCMECLKEYQAYKWEESRRAQIGTTATKQASESSTVSRADSTDSLLDGFEKLDMENEVAHDSDMMID